MSQHLSSYPIPANEQEVDYEIKKSRFIARVGYAQNRQQALDILARAQQAYPDARHHCWAYLIGPPNSPATAAMSDDGEPSGTAGKPILNVLQHKGIGDIMIVVSRYFGGIKLGAGGLVRAYSQAAQMGVDALELAENRPLLRQQLSCDFAQEQPIRHWLSEHQGELIGIEYSQQVTMTVAIPFDLCEDWQAFAQGLGVLSAPLTD